MLAGRTEEGQTILDITLDIPRCVAILGKDGALSRPSGRRLQRPKDLDEAYRTLHESCYGSRIPR